VCEALSRMIETAELNTYSYWSILVKRVRVSVCTDTGAYGSVIHGGLDHRDVYVTTGPVCALPVLYLCDEYSCTKRGGVYG
jgi:hypothetical protein